ncbi:trypsin-like peptidase domain-containing protein [Nevskia soli]|uniref:trypsin-like peptidase domain-containing protein n=1 Tax=Nevskia soli TaxID=418856 RepID=UPI000A03D443|nr:trypsin-like peptidase domain-containing protein [Nevskia soli]
MYRQIAQHGSGGCLMIVRHRENDVEFVCSGFLCHNAGYVLTCAHSISLTDKLSAVAAAPLNQFNPVTLQQVHALDLSIAQYDPQNDVALLKFVHSPEVTVPEKLLGQEDGVQVGASVCYMGFPFGHSGLHTLKVSASIISAKVISSSASRQFQIDAMVHEGNSGGPLFELNTGQIIGIILGRFSPTGTGGGISIGNHPLGTESTISYAGSISYGRALLKAEGLNV